VIAKVFRVAPVLICFLLPIVLAAQSKQTIGAPPSTAEARHRADSLLSRMTLEEKIGQLTQIFFQYFPDETTPDDRIRKGQVGSYLFLTDPKVINHLQHIAIEESRMHIPLLIGFDVIHGFRTIFPVPLAMAASWDPKLVEQIQSVAAEEASAAGVKWAFAPMVDIARDPRWGRIVEGAGEDPFLGAAMARAQVIGFQGPYLGSTNHILATVKHFAGYGAPDGGRDYDSSYLSEDLLRNVYLPPFKAAVDAGVGSVMSAYMDLNDIPASGNRYLLHDVLRNEWGFQGFVVSDAFAVQDLKTHGFARDASDAAYRAFAAGVNMDMGSKTYLAKLPDLVRQGKVSPLAIDDAVRPLLMAKLQLGLFEHPYVDTVHAEEVLKATDHRVVERNAASRTAVLLRNGAQLLPLKKTLSSLTVIGPLADSQKALQGSWSFASDPAEVVTVLQGIRAKLPASTHIEYVEGTEIKREFDTEEAGPDTEIGRAVDAARRSEVTVLVLGELDDMSGEAASRSSLELPGKQAALIKAVVATGKPVVLVLINGRPLNITWASTHVPAILEAWYPGTQGGNAIADVLFGDVNPGGKLPFTWPRSVGQIPIYYAHNLTHLPETSEGFVSRYWDGPNSPLYPFGYGLSYTKFAISNLKLDQSHVKIDGSLGVSAIVENTGDRTGDEVVQLYLHQRAGSASRPVRVLQGFERIKLKPGETKTVRFTLDKKNLSFWSPSERRWVEEPEEFDLWIGDDSTAALHAVFKVDPQK
jgi:beta-glucosidase